MTSILIQNGRIWDGVKFFYGDILTEDGRIVQIADHIEANAKFIYDATGKTVSAGLVDIHLHLKGFSSDEHGILAPMGCLPFGVTAACDAGARQGSHVQLSQCGVKSVAFADCFIENNHLNLPVTRQRLTPLGHLGIGLKVYLGASKKFHDITPLLEAREYAAKQGLKLMVHCNNSPFSMASIVEALAPGDILSHVYHGQENDCTEADFEAFRLAKEKGVVMDAAFAGHIHTDFAVLRTAIAAGHLPDTISTDLTINSAYRRGGRYGLPMCMSMARTAGMAEEDIFRAVTSAPAKALGQSWGRLTVGSVADLAILDYTNEGFSLTDRAGNTLQSPTGYRCELTISDGIVLYRH